MKQRDIKTKEKYTVSKDRKPNIIRPNTMGRCAIVATGRKIQQTAERETPRQKTPEQYAQTHVIQAANATIRETAYQGKRLAGSGIRKAENALRRKAVEQKSPHQDPTHSGQTARQQYRMRTIRGWQASRSRSSAQTVQNGVRQQSQAIQKSAQASGKAIKSGTKGIKAAGKGIKAAGKGINTGVKTAKITARTTARTAQAMARASARLAHAAKAAAKAIVTAAKALAKVAAAAAKAVAAALKALIAWIAAGGWVVLLVILAVAVIVLVLGSAFGIFFSDEVNNGRLKQAIVDTNAQFTADIQAEIDRLSSGGYDAVVVSYDGDYDGDGAMVNNWQDVLAVFATKNMYEGQELLEFDDAKAAAMALVFNHMNETHIDTRVETETTTTVVDGEEVTETFSTLYINISIESMTYLEGADLYRFDDEQRDMLEQLMSQEYNALWADLLDVDIYGGLTYTELMEISNNLPTGTRGGSITDAALSKLGTAYSVMDCSQLTQYAYAQVGVSLPRTSVEQAKYCYNNGYAISRGQLQPGDLIFWSKACSCGRWNEIHHTGVYIGNGKIVDASSSKGRVVLRNLWGEDGSTWKIVLYARPHIG